MKNSALFTNTFVFGIAFLILGFTLPCHIISQPLPTDVKNLENLTVHPAETQPQFAISLSKVSTYSETDEVLFGNFIRKIEVDEDGRVYILDLRQSKVHVFDANGDFIQSVGREGRGPGEFLQIADMQVGHGQLHILDRQQQKVSVFSQGSFEHVQDIDISFQANNTQPPWLERTREQKTYYQPNDLIARTDGNYYVIFSDKMVATASNLPGRTYEFSLFDTEQETYTRHDVLSFDWTGGVRLIDTGRGTSISFFVPYKRASRFDYANNTLVYGWNEHFLFKFYDDEGNYQRAFYYPFNKQPLSVENVLAYTEYTSPRSEELVEMDNLPDTWPAFHTVVFDDENRLWVSTFTDNPDEHKWRVLDETGTLLAAFNWPKEYNLQQVRNGYAYALQRDPETGLFSVSKHRIEME